MRKVSKIIVISLIILLAGACSFFAYKYYNMNEKDNTNEIVEKCENIQNDTNNNDSLDYSKITCEDINDSDKKYSNYIKNLKESLSKLNKEDSNNKFFISSNSMYFEKGYSFEIYNNKLLFNLEDELVKNTYKDYVISENVLDMFLVSKGNGGYKYLYFIKEDGSLNSFCVECLLNSEMKIKKVELKRIVSVKEIITSEAREAVFIDIDGNVFHQY